MRDGPEAALRPVVSGAGGFLGRWVTRHLLDQGIKPVLLVRQGSAPTPPSGCEVVVYDPRDPLLATSALHAHAPTTFIHLAWQGVSGRHRSSTAQLTFNVPFGLSTVELAAAAGCRHWIGLGSQAEYAPLARAIREDDATGPTTMYGKAKLACFEQASALAEKRGLAFTWLRLFSAYGPGDSPDCLIPTLVTAFRARRAPELTGCEQIWDYLYAADAASAIGAVARQAQPGLFNLGSGEAVQLKAVVEALRRMIAPEVAPAYGAIPYSPTGPMHLVADVAALRRAVGWRPATSLPDGLAACSASFF